MGKTIDGFRLYQCKSCGHEVKENVYWWRKKPQTKKNICFDCLRNRELKEQTFKEKCRDTMNYARY